MTRSDAGSWFAASSSFFTLALPSFVSIWIPDFARNVNRDDITVGAAELGVDLDEHIAFVLAALELVLYDKLLRRVLQALAALGILASLYFTFLQVFIIGALCVYCLGSALTTTLIFIFACFIEPVPRLKKAPPPRPPALTMPPA